MVRNYDNDSDIKRFSHSIGQNWYHIVLIPKGRFPIFQWKILRDIADKAIIDVCKKHSIDLFEKEVMEDHIHLFVSCPPNYSIRRLFQILKGGTSYQIRKNYLSLKKYSHLWARGTMYRSLGSVSADAVQKYIKDSNVWKGI
ncbi:MAG: IS200/IS605 family transposase [Nanoarchaeota archaeon]|nr:IS200/IS605 family transposase [Nanoarchaeota archaeon]